MKIFVKLTIIIVSVLIVCLFADFYFGGIIFGPICYKLSPDLELKYTEAIDHFNASSLNKEQGEELFHIGKTVMHGGGTVDGIDATNSKEALNSNYEKGIRFFEIDFNRSRDQKIVMIHDWSESVVRFFGLEAGRLSQNDFKSMKISGKYTPLSLTDLIDWMDKHPDAYIITDFKTNNTLGLYEISFRSPEMVGRFIPQIYYFHEYLLARKLGYKNLIFTLYRSNYSVEQIKRFIKKHKIAALTVPSYYGGLTSLLIDDSIKMLVHTVNDRDVRDKLFSKGVYGIYTDSLVD
jgi:glycerophosphoryl diester phosphodiesterase